MSRQTYRVIVTKSQLYSIDIGALNETHAIERAESLWYGRSRDRFAPVAGGEPDRFDIDHDASMHLADVATEDRAQWAEKALRCFSHETGSGIGREALHDLLCDLGHYAETLALDFHAELERAAAVWEEEKREEAAAQR